MPSATQTHGKTSSCTGHVVLSPAPASHSQPQASSQINPQAPAESQHVNGGGSDDKRHDHVGRNALVNLPPVEHQIAPAKSAFSATSSTTRRSGSSSCVARSRLESNIRESGGSHCIWKARMTTSYLIARLELADLATIAVFALFIFLVLTWSLKYSAISTVFVVVNFSILYSWFSILPVDEGILRDFISDIKVGAHRGLAADFPENTLTAIRQCAKLGANAVEFDVEFTNDSIAVLMHDDTLDRTTDGRGPISQINFDSLRLLNAAAKFPERGKFGHEVIPSLEEALQESMKAGLKIFIDVKATNPQLISTLVDLFARYPVLYKTAAVCSFFPNVIYQLRIADPKIITGHTWRPGFFAYVDGERTVQRFLNPLKHIGAVAADFINEWLIHSWLYKVTGASLILAEHGTVSGEYIRFWHQRGLQVVAWTVNDFHEKVYYLRSLGCPFLTDRMSDLQPQHNPQAPAQHHQAPAAQQLPPVSKDTPVPVLV